MINFGIYKFFDYIKNNIVGREPDTIYPIDREVHSNKRTVFDFNGDNDSDDEEISVIEPPYKRSKLYESPEFSSHIYEPGPSKYHHFSQFKNFKQPSKMGSRKSLGGAIRRSQLEVSPEEKKYYHCGDDFEKDHIESVEKSNYKAQPSRSTPNIDPMFRFKPSIYSTAIRNTKDVLEVLKRRPPISQSRNEFHKIDSRKASVKNIPRIGSVLEKKKKNNTPSGSTFSNLLSKMKKYNTPMQSYRLEERSLYKKLLQQHTSSSIGFNKVAEVKFALASTASYRKDEYVARSSGAVKKSILDQKWTLRKKQMLDQEDRNGTPFPKEATSVLSACTSRSGRIPLIDLEAINFPIKNTDDDILITKEVVVSKPESNSLEDRLKKSEFYDSNWFHNLKENNREKKDVRESDLKHWALEKSQWEDHRKALTHARLIDSVNKRISLLDIKYPVKVIEISDEEEQLPELTREIEAVIDRALKGGPAGQVLAEKFNIQVTRKDLHTLSGLNWLNDEVINFYMNLIMERNQLDNKLPNIYAFNTFFYSKLIKMGYGSVKRWTKKVDIFSHDLLIIPVHLGMHWCLATIDFRAKAIRYYDSMLGDNHHCLTELKKYLESEHQDKKKSPYDGSSLSVENVKDIPQQMNGSDCGMFSCKFAEYLSRDSNISFTQEHMPYFRRRMVYEIVSKTLM